MRFRYKDPRGKVVTLPDVASLLKAIRDGAITPDAPLALGDDGTFQRAELVIAYQQAVVAVSRTGGTPAVAAAAPPAPWHARPLVRIGLGVAAAGLVVSLAVWRIHAIDRQNARVASAAVVPSGPSRGTRSVIAGSTGEFGDSAAVAQHRLESWVERQRFAQRFRGAALVSGASLRAVRAAAARYRQEIDAMLLRSRNLAVVLVQRADSTESLQPALAGLMSEVEDALVEWQRDLTAYAEIQRTAAATLDSLAGFLLGHQQSFAIRDGEPVFLSRQDAARFRELTATLNAVAGRENAWADALKGRRPGWMTSLAEAERPRFGRRILSGPASN